MDFEQRPDTIQLDANDQLLPRGPWSFMGEALKGAWTSWGIQLILAWVAFEALTRSAWVSHLRALTGQSALPSYWGELLTARDLWELAVNGGLKDNPAGKLAPMLGALALVWVLWAGWKLQSGTVGLEARFRTWAWGAIDALLIAALPLYALAFTLTWVLENLASSGIQGLGWLDFVGSPIIQLACLSAFSLQWWLCRLDRASHSSGSWHLGGVEALVRHLGRSFLRLWLHPIQWGSLVLGGVIFRLGLHVLVFLLAWQLGGGTPARIWIFLILESLATALSAWQLGWFLRQVALFWRQDSLIQREVKALEQLVEGES
jgi:hypothetical protein